MKERWPLYPKAARALKNVGSDLRDTRRRRRIATKTLAERGESGVSLSSYTAVIFALGLLDHLQDAFDARFDTVGLGLEAEQLPQNIVNKRYDQ